MTLSICPTTGNFTWRSYFGLLVGILLLQACATAPQMPPGIGEPMAWQQVPGWEQDNHQQAWPALLNNCIALQDTPPWQAICAAAAEITGVDNTTVRLFFEAWFVPHKLHGRAGTTTGLITGYYEPLLHGSLSPTAEFRYPLYSPPPSLLRFAVADVYPQANDSGWRGRVEGRKILPFYTRAEIEATPAPLAGTELIWVNSRDDVFFLHVQGSGRVRLNSGETLGVNYVDNNGQGYVSIGSLLLSRGELPADGVSLFSIRQWLADNPDEADSLLAENPRYIFFGLRDSIESGPFGSLNVPLTAQRSIAVDPRVVPLGTPVWLTTTVPGSTSRLLQQLVIAQDTGAAIEGDIRADLFWGEGNDAEQMAGIMRETGSMLVFLPRSQVAGVNGPGW
jgi:membrane-bound lytic murein transglycosylase A